jgi:hypothetical protein
MRYTHLSLLAFLSLSITATAQSPDYTVHEWGTFTSLYGSNGTQLSDVFREEEKLPAFVYKLSGIGEEGGQRIITEGGEYYTQTQLTNVTVKMETPVIYFYSEQALTANVKVSFSKGLIGQWYPQCSARPLIGYRESTIAGTPYIYVTDGREVDFAKTSNTAQWTVNVNAPGTPEGAVKKAGETNTWTAPRETDANVVSFGKEYEKYIFYRGLGNFSMPVKVEFDINGILQIQNAGLEKIPYLFVYERTDDGKALVYWTGELEPGAREGVHVDVVTQSTFTEKIGEFQKALVAAGLYDKEASAMLKTWQQSYFNHTGLRVFWIAPRSFTDQVIPLSITPAPKSIERVLVGRSEILKPQFEKKLVENRQFRFKLENDRFYLAIGNRVNDFYNHPGALDSVKLKIANQAAENAEYEKLLKTEEIRIKPNGTECNIIIDRPQQDGASIWLSDMLGHPIMNIPLGNLARLESYSHHLDLSALPAGMYIVQVQTGTQKYRQRIVKI